MHASRQAIDKHFADKRRIVVLSLKSDKAAEEILTNVMSDTDLLIITEFRVEKSLWQAMEASRVAQLAATMAPELSIRVIPDPVLAFNEALSEAGADDLIWVTGSFYLVGNVREFWYPSPVLIAEAENGLSGALAL
jgi:folylpolyglutamate synthase/dihydropteroate synthase